ncbi:YcxB family protein [Streptacidiphilus anmyonensis]|uniref:YcxB family protein n=1 Tax=Streptacidiphilus anmyonensis TaxID=405782 RepID=UPI0005A96424|nr:YcxB family protein [Streptacidiphilus anmyonensis]
MDIEVEFEYQRGEARRYWLRQQGVYALAALLVGLTSVVVAALPGAAHPARGTLALVGLLCLAWTVYGIRYALRNLPRPGSTTSLRFTDVGLSMRDQFQSTQIRWPAVRRVQLRRGWLLLEGTQTVRNRAIPARALSEVQLEELQGWLTAQKLMR